MAWSNFCQNEPQINYLTYCSKDFKENNNSPQPNHNPNSPKYLCSLTGILVSLHDEKNKRLHDETFVFKLIQYIYQVVLYL